MNKEGRGGGSSAVLAKVSERSCSDMIEYDDVDKIITHVNINVHDQLSQRKAHNWQNLSGR